MSINEKISNLIGQSDIKQQIIYQMNNAAGGIFEIIGPTGCGKRTLSNLIAQDWQKISNCKTITLEADPKVPLIDYDVFIKSLRNNVINAEDIVTIFTEALKDIPYIPNTSSVIAALIGKKISKKLSVFPDDEQYIYQCLKKIVGRGNVLFICNDFDQWDLKSQGLLTKIIYSNANIDKVYFIITSPLRYFNNQSIPFHINYIKYDIIEEILQELRPEMTLSKDFLKQYYKLSRGNLSLIKDSISLINYSPQKKELILNEMLLQFIEEKAGKDKSEEINNLLKNTAFIGKTVEEILLIKFTDMNKKDYEHILGKSIDSKFLDKKEPYICFLDDIVYGLYCANPLKGYEYSHRLADCIKLLYPSQYSLQYYFYKRGGFNSNATEKLMLYLLQCMKDNKVSQNITATEERLLEEDRNSHIFSQLYDAYNKYNQKDYINSEKILSNIYPEDIFLQFEKEFLLGLIVTNRTFNIDLFKEQIDVLQKYTSEDFEIEYPELYIRNCMLLIEFNSETNNFEEVTTYMRLFYNKIQKYSKTDKNFYHYEYRLKMKANMIYKIEIAYRYTLDAVQYFGSNNNKARFMSKYYLSLLNHSANEIVMGNWNDALKYLSIAQSIAIQYPDMEMLNEDVLINNLTLANFYADIEDASLCYSTMLRLIDPKKTGADNTLLKNNAAVFCALSGNYQKAFEWFDELYKEVSYACDTDDYYKYFIYNNYGIMLWIVGNWKKATDILISLKEMNPLPKDSAYFQVRTKKLLSFVKTNSPFSILGQPKWNSILVQPNAVGAAWNFWGNLLLFTELQIWSDC